MAILNIAASPPRSTVQASGDPETDCQWLATATGWFGVHAALGEPFRQF